MFIRVEIKAYKRQFNASNYCADTTLNVFFCLFLFNGKVLDKINYLPQNHLLRDGTDHRKDRYPK